MDGVWAVSDGPKNILINFSYCSWINYGGASVDLWAVLFRFLQVTLNFETSSLVRTYVRTVVKTIAVSTEFVSAVSSYIK